MDAGIRERSLDIPLSVKAYPVSFGSNIVNVGNILCSTLPMRAANIAN